MHKSGVALAVAMLSALPAQAASLLTTGGPPVTPAQFNTTYTFDAGDTGPFAPANVRSGTTANLYAQPMGSVAPYYSVGPSTTNPVAIAYDASWGNQFYLYWGSIDTYNAIELLGAGNAVLDTVTGAMAADPVNAQGSQTSLDQNRNVTVTLTGAERAAITGLRFRSDFGGTAQNAFEFDNFSVNSAVPEPATWAMMLLGFGLVGAAARRRQPRLVAA